MQKRRSEEKKVYAKPQLCIWVRNRHVEKQKRAIVMNLWNSKVFSSSSVTVILKQISEVLLKRKCKLGVFLVSTYYYCNKICHTKQVTLLFRCILTVLSVSAGEHLCFWRFRFEGTASPTENTKWLGFKTGGYVWSETATISAKDLSPL